MHFSHRHPCHHTVQLRVIDNLGLDYKQPQIDSPGRRVRKLSPWHSCASSQNWGYRFQGQLSAPGLAPREEHRLFRNGLKIRSPRHQSFHILALVIFLLAVLKIPHFYMSRNAETWGQSFKHLYILFIWMLDIKLSPNLVIQYTQTLEP